MHNSFQNAIQPKENKKILSSPLWLLFPHSMKRLQCSSHQQAQRKQQCIFSSTRKEIRIFHSCSSGADTSTDRGNTAGLPSMIEKRYLLMLNLEYFYFIYRRLNIKANFQVKQVTHYTEVILQETWSPWQPFMSFFTLLWYKDITTKGC